MRHQILIAQLAIAALTTLGLGARVPFEDGFDDIEVVPEVGLLNPVGTYHGKTFTGFFVVQPGIPGVITLNGVAPQTPPNQAVLKNTANMPPAITLAQGTKSFALSSYYFGCAPALDQSVIDLATGCNITATGYGSTAEGAKPIVSQVFDFEPMELLEAQQAPAFGRFGPEFTNLAKVTFVSNPGPPTVSILLDQIVGSLET